MPTPPYGTCVVPRVAHIEGTRIHLNSIRPGLGRVPYGAWL